MEKIETIIFDLGGVILDIDYNLTRTAFEKLGITHFDEMYSQATANQLFKKLETGKISENDFYKELNLCTGLHLSPTEINQAWNAMLLSFREKSLRFLNGINPKYQLFLLSNTNYIHIKAFQKIFYSKERTQSFEDYFNKAFYSCDIGLRKPDPVCYTWALNELKTEPSKILFIDDSAQNVEGAKEEGMQALLLSPGTNIEDLGL